MDNEELRVASTPRAWVAVVLFTAILLAVEAHPGSGGWLVFDPLRVTGALLICLVLAAHVWAVRRRDGARFSRWQGLALLIGTSGTQFYAATLYLGTAPPASLFFGLLFMVACLANGGQTRAGVQRPWMAVGTLVAVGAALVWTATDVRWGELLVVCLAGVLLELIAGEMAYSKQRATEEAARLRAVVHAQLLRQQEQEAERLNDAIGGAVQTGQLLRSVVAEAASICDLLQGLASQLGPRHGVQFLRLQGLMSRLDSLIQDSVGQQVPATADREPVPLSPMLGLVIDSVRFRFPHVVFETRGTLPEDVEGLVLGGPVGCRRILESVLVNACEGDGSSAATRVVITPALSPYSEHVTLEIFDDGPGFPSEVLAAPVEGLLTTKEGRQSGLGLYTAAATLTASGGGLHRENAKPSGARVTLRIPARSQALLRARA